MMKIDFKLKRIKHFTYREVEATGADMYMVDWHLIKTLDNFRKEAGRPIILLYNGINSGKHQSAQHYLGRAVDVCFREVDGLINWRGLVHDAWKVGFRGIGGYWNGTAYSMHLDIRDHPGTWIRWKHHHNGDWTETAMLRDPQEEERSA